MLCTDPTSLPAITHFIASSPPLPRSVSFRMLIWHSFTFLDLLREAIHPKEEASFFEFTLVPILWLILLFKTAIFLATPPPYPTCFLLSCMVFFTSSILRLMPYPMLLSIQSILTFLPSSVRLSDSLQSVWAILAQPFNIWIPSLVLSLMTSIGLPVIHSMPPSFISSFDPEPHSRPTGYHQFPPS
jgi:hypothetical protein